MDKFNYFTLSKKVFRNDCYYCLNEVIEELNKQYNLHLFITDPFDNKLFMRFCKEMQDDYLETNHIYKDIMYPYPDLYPNSKCYMNEIFLRYLLELYVPK